MYRSLRRTYISILLLAALVSATASLTGAAGEDREVEVQVATGQRVTPYGPDHVDAHRSPAFVISAYSKRNAVVHTFYNTMNVLRTIEDLFGLNHLGMNDSNSDPMSDVFTTKPDFTPYLAVLPGSLCQGPVHPDLVPECHQASVPRTPSVQSLHDGAWWAKATRNFNFKRPDAVDSAAFNRVLWRGMMGNKPYPTLRSRRDDDDREGDRRRNLCRILEGSLSPLSNCQTKLFPSAIDPRHDACRPDFQGIYSA